VLELKSEFKFKSELQIVLEFQPEFNLA